MVWSCVPLHKAVMPPHWAKFPIRVGLPFRALRIPAQRNVTTLAFYRNAVAPISTNCRSATLGAVCTDLCGMHRHAFEIRDII